MKKILITGFEPFGGSTINPALEAVKRIDGLELTNGKVHTAIIPVVLQKSIDAVLEAIEQVKPDAVLLIGQASGRTTITPERVAINMDDFRIPDNEGNQVIDEPVVAGGPDAYFATLPVKAMVAAMRESGIPASVSNTAGTFVCNHLFYGIMHALKETSVKAGFIHIPLVPEQNTDGSQPTMALESIVKGLEICAETTLAVQEDIKMGAGTIN